MTRNVVSRIGTWTGLLLASAAIGCAHPQEVKHANRSDGRAGSGESGGGASGAQAANEGDGARGGQGNLGTAIYFDYDATELTSAATALLEQYAEAVKKTGKTLRIEGNCDERGTDEYNLALGQHRADAARQYLARLGVPVTRVQTVSYGSERPKGTGHDESSWQENRRDDLVLR